jgi:uncharacterized protein YciI
MTELGMPKTTYVLQLVTKFASLADASHDAPDEIAAHIARSKEFHARGELLMAGAFLDVDGEALSTMAVLTTREAAEDYANGDPFVLNGMVSEWRVREWANIVA